MKKNLQTTYITLLSILTVLGIAYTIYKYEITEIKHWVWLGVFVGGSYLYTNITYRILNIKEGSTSLDDSFLLALISTPFHSLLAILINFIPQWFKRRKEENINRKMLYNISSLFILQFISYHIFTHFIKIEEIRHLSLSFVIWMLTCSFVYLYGSKLLISFYFMTVEVVRSWDDFKHILFEKDGTFFASVASMLFIFFFYTEMYIGLFIPLLLSYIIFENNRNSVEAYYSKIQSEEEANKKKGALEKISENTVAITIFSKKLNQNLTNLKALSDGNKERFYLALKSFKEEKNRIEKIDSAIEMIKQKIDVVEQSASEMLLSAENNKQHTKKGKEQIQSFAMEIEETDVSLNQIKYVSDHLIRESNEVLNIVKIIESISQKIRLLSFNANVEATRSGNNDNGFIVVAQEIKKLSEETAVSVKKIAQLLMNFKSGIDNINQKIEESKNIMSKTKTSNLQIKELFENISDDSENLNEKSIQVGKVIHPTKNAIQEMVKEIENILLLVEENDNVLNMIYPSMEKQNHETAIIQENFILLEQQVKNIQ